MVSSAPKWWGCFNFEKLKSLEKSFFSSYGKAGPYRGSDIGNQRGRGLNSGQNNYYTIAFFQDK